MNRNKKGTAAPQAAAKNKKQNRKSAAKGPRNVLQSAPVAVSRVGGLGVPKYSVLPNGDIRIRHKEYITDVNLGYLNNIPFTQNEGLFNTISFPANPGLVTSFPWLSGRAAGYEKYRWNSLRFCHETEAPTSQAGTILLLFDPNAADPAPGSKQTALQLQAKSRGAPWQEFALDVPRAMLSPPQIDAHYIRTGALAANLDIKTYDVGNLIMGNIASSILASSGELYIEYDVTLMNPQQPAVNPPSMKIVGSAGLGAANLFGSNAVLTGNAPGFLSTTSTTNDTFTFTRDYQGLLVAGLTGTVMSGSLSNTGTCTFTAESGTVLAAATSGTVTGIVSAVANQTLILNITATTVTASTVRLGEYLFATG